MRAAVLRDSDVHYMDHQNSAPRFAWGSDRDTIIGHEFIGEVVGHDPDAPGAFYVRCSRIEPGELPLVIGAGIVVHPSTRNPHEVERETFRTNGFQTPQVIFECVGANGLLPSIGRVVGLDEVPDTIEKVRRCDGPPRIVVHTTGS